MKGGKTNRIYDCIVNPSMIAPDLPDEITVSVPWRKSRDTASAHSAICAELGDIYIRKNADYGASFHRTFVEEGFAMARIRLTDKLERFKQLTRSGSKQQVADESIRDTLLDLANYAIMTVMEIDADVSYGQ